MVTLKSVEKQLKRISFNHGTWNRAEAMELPNILMPGEEIYECVNGTYEGGFALLCATNVRLLLIDKKPFKFLTVEDLRFDMINQIDYSHRLFGARISVSAGSKNLSFRSVNQERLRKLISHIQHCMAESKKSQSNNAESQQLHLEQINQQLQAYLLAQHQQQEELRKQLLDAHMANSKSNDAAATLPPQPEPVKPSPQLSDYLFAQTLLKQYKSSQNQVGEVDNDTINASIDETQVTQSSGAPLSVAKAKESHENDTGSPQLAELYAAGMEEIFGKQEDGGTQTAQLTLTPQSTPSISNPLEINPLRIAYSKLPMALRDRAFARRTLRSRRVNSAAATKPTTTQPAAS